MDVKLSFVSIDWHNLDQVIDLKVREEQNVFLPDIKTFLSQAYVNLKLGYQELVYGIKNHDQMIGFTKVIYVGKGVEPYQFDEDGYLIDAFMIDRHYQDQHLGRHAFSKLLSIIQKFPMGIVHCFYLICHEDNSVAHRFFEAFDFVHTKMYQRNGKSYRIYKYVVK